MKFRITTLLCFLLVLLTFPTVGKAETFSAEEITSKRLVTHTEGFQYCTWLFDGAVKSGQNISPNSSFRLEAAKGIGSYYLIYKVPHGEYTVINEDTGEEKICGTHGFLHEFVDITQLFGGPVHKLTVKFGEEPPILTELRVFTEGEPPADVQRWQVPPEEGVDLLVFPTHGDDEQLFFAGMLPYYAGELGYQVQVVYSTDHANFGTERPHEMLDGLWASGVTNYPVFGPFPDYMSKSARVAMEGLERRGYSEDCLRGFVVEQLRKFKPQVVVGHDLNGEYGHGMHRLYAEMVRQAVEVSGDSASYPESAETYGVWDVPKTYLHLYPENQIVMDWDIPLEHFDGMTAYQVTKTYGFPAHKSQYSGFAWYMGPHERASDIPEMSPCIYGLVRSTVGEDVEKNDLFENLTVRSQIDAAEEQKRLEEEQRKAEEEAEEQRRLEQERLQAEAEAKALEESREAQQQEEVLRQSRNKLIGFLAVIFGTLLVLSVVIFTIKLRR